jgi:hypothetical protein
MQSPYKGKIGDPLEQGLSSAGTHSSSFGEVLIRINTNEWGKTV